MSIASRLIGEFVSAGSAKIQTGPFGTQLKASDYVEDGTPVINVRNIGYADLRQEKLEYVGPEMAERLSAHLLQENDIVFGRKGAVDRHLLVTSEYSGWMQGSDCIRLRIESPEVLPRYVSYAFLRSEHQQWMLIQSGSKATMASLNQEIIHRISLKLPSLVVQKKIVLILSSYDDLIENNRRRMTLLEQSARLLYEEWFVRLRFPGHEHTRISDGVPSGWSKIPLDEVLFLQRGFDLPHQDRMEGEVPIYGASGINGRHCIAKVTGPGIVTGRAGSLGTVHFVPGDFWPLNTSLWVKEFRLATPLFALHLLRAMKLERYGQGATMPMLDRKVVHKVDVLVPPPSVMKIFESFAEDIQRQVQTLELNSEKLRAARDLLLPRLMSGELVT